MVLINIKLEKNKNYIKKYTSTGHTDKITKGYNVCALISLLEQIFIVSLKEIIKLDFASKLSKGVFEYNLKQIKEKDIAGYIILSKNLFLGIKLLKKKFAGQIKLKIGD